MSMPSDTHKERTRNHCKDEPPVRHVPENHAGEAIMDELWTFNAESLVIAH